ncbi:MAG: hypothetical protein V1672_01420 [Candidatus Diapherotrites archaeon]
MTRNSMKKRRSVTKDNYSDVRGFLLHKRNLDKIKSKRFQLRVEKFLSNVWKKSYEKHHKKKGLELPTKKQRMFGSSLPKKDLRHIKEQTHFAVSVFAQHLSKTEQKKLLLKINHLIKKKNLNICTFINFSKSPKEIQRELAMLYHYFKRYGESYIAYIPTNSCNIYFSKGWSQDRCATGVPLHESIHVLHKLGVIKIDIPFAQAADKLYGLEKGSLKKKHPFRKLNVKDFDRKPSVKKTINGIEYYKEPYWSYEVGEKMGYWIFENLSGKKRWKYLVHRCDGLSHRATLKMIKK